VISFFPCKKEEKEKEKCYFEYRKGFKKNITSTNVVAWSHRYSQVEKAWNA
jgi:hypothetical protein